MADRTITTDLIGRDRISPAAESAGRSVTRLGKTGVILGASMKVGAAAAGLAGSAIGKLGGFVVQGVKDAASYQTVLKKTAAVLKSTGAASGQTVKGIQDQAAALETLSGVDEELIINSQNVLATFTNIKNVGKNKIFDQATKSALDMSVALGSDLQGSSIMLGKALNDPVKGMTALSKSGVTFTDAQKKAVEQMVKTGDTAGAQKLILKELNKEFGGAAKAAGSGAAGDWARFQDVIADTGRSIGQALLPFLTKIVKWANENLPPAIETASAAIGTFKDAFTSGDSSGGFIADAGKTVRVLVDFVSNQAIPAVKAIVGVIKEWAPVLVPVAAGILAVVGAIKVWQAVTKAYIAVQAALNVVLALNPIGLVILAVVGLSAAIVIAWKRSETFRVLVTAAFKVTANVILTAIGGILGAFGDLFGVLGRMPGPAGAPFRAAAKAADAAKGKVDALNRSIQNMKTHKEVNIRVNTTYAVYGKKGGHYVGSTFVPDARAKGGPVMKGQPYIVGEKRAEVFVPKSSGRILPKVPTWMKRRAKNPAGAIKRRAKNPAGAIKHSPASPASAIRHAPAVRPSIATAVRRSAAPSMPAGTGGAPDYSTTGGGGDTYNFYITGVVAGQYTQLADTVVTAFERRPAGSRPLPASAVASR